MQGDFTKDEAIETIVSVKEIMAAFSKKKKVEFMGHFNDIFLFLEAGRQVALEKVNEY